MTDFTPADLAQLEQKGISIEAVEAQLARFRDGFPYLRIISAASAADSLHTIDAARAEEYRHAWRRFLADGGQVLKFVPASGAASRMFKALFAFVNGQDDTPAPGSPVAELIANIDKLAFYGQLQDKVQQLYGTTVEALIAEGRYKDVIGTIIRPEGLNYGQLPKALLTFHRYDDGTTRTALEEQLAEGAQTAASGGKVDLHFTVSTEHRKLFEEMLAKVVPAMEARFGVKYNISLSEQKPSTDTIAVTPDNELFRDDAGRLVFRPGGHGALIENLNDIDSTVVFIKNIDNVVSDKNRRSTIEYKELLGGVLVTLHSQIEEQLAHLAADSSDEATQTAIDFLKDKFYYSTPAFDGDAATRRAAAIAALRRPTRVCGMVRNEGEPGGGPYNTVCTADGSTGPQILESTQIDMSNAEYVEMMKTSGYFNPVDLVCYLRTPEGGRYDLRRHVDPATGFISEKSAGGRDLRALELPGLWNGAMSDWNTFFVEVPASTFNPVKTVNDLLRPAHQ